MDLLMLPKLLVLMNLVLLLLRLDQPSSLQLLVPALPLPLKLNSLSFWLGFYSRSEERLDYHIYNEDPYGLSPCRHVGWWHDMNGRMILSEPRGSTEEQGYTLRSQTDRLVHGMGTAESRDTSFQSETHFPRIAATDWEPAQGSTTSTK